MRARKLVLTVLIIAVAITALALGCNPYYGTRFGTGFLKGVAARQNATSQIQASGPGKLMVFGGPNHSVYLGCLSCPEYFTDSLFNDSGLNGSKYGPNSIWNAYGTYGSPYSSFSPWNEYAADPPVVVDQYGNFHGYFTVNEYHAQRTTVPRALQVLSAPPGK